MAFTVTFVKFTLLLEDTFPLAFKVALTALSLALMLALLLKVALPIVVPVVVLRLDMLPADLFGASCDVV